MKKATHQGRFKEAREGFSGKAMQDVVPFIGATRDKSRMMEEG
jgi:hypothetical protein